MFKKILIANRGEIAVRIIRACKEMGIKSVAIFSEADREALHVKLADQAVCIGSAQSKDSYLNMENIISAAIGVGAKAIHPGFGFLSENALFAEKCELCNITFIGPSSDVIRRMGNKIEARDTMMKAGVSVVPGSKIPIYEVKDAIRVSSQIGFPAIIKATAGGGGKGMRVVKRKEEFQKRFMTAQLEAKNSFGNDAMYIERYIENPHHIEFQIMADKYGKIIQLGERDCSLQLHHQKVIEETPSPVLSTKIRKKMGETAINVAKAANYEGIGTVEFLLDDYDNFYFIEMNTRVQVEHAITEMVVNLDIIKEQIKIASGYPLDIDQDDIVINGHSIECRINAENSRNNFMPCSGTITKLHFPGGNGVRIDTALYNGYTIPPYYDSMLAKIIVHDVNRNSAIDRMRSALNEIIIEGVPTNIEFQRKILSNKNFREGKFTTDFIYNELR